MRILYFSESYRPYIGGVETLSEALLGALRERGHDVSVVTNLCRPSDAEQDEIDGIPIRRLPMSWALAEGRLDIGLRIVSELSALKRRFEPDIVHLAWSGPSDFYHWRSGTTSPTLVTLHCGLPSGPTTEHMRRRASRVVAVSPALGEFPVVWNGYPAPAAPLSGLPREPVVLAMGRLVRDKGFDLLVDAWPLVRARYATARLVLAGDGPERSRLSGPGVETVGWVAPERVYEIVDAARVVAVPSRWNEPFGLVALDAAWRERPVVAARRGGLVDVVEHGRTGLLVEPERKEELAGALLALLDDFDLASRMGRAARARAEERFSLERMVTAYEGLYEELVDAARVSTA